MLPTYTGALDFSKPMNEYFFSQGKSIVDVTINLTGFALVGGPATQDHPKAIETLKSLNAPYMVSLPLVFQTTEEWSDSSLGLHPVQVALQVALNSSGQPSGFGFVQFSSSEDTTAALGRSKERMGTRYVEVFRSTCGEMEAARAHAFVVVQQRQALQHGGMQGSGAYQGMAAGQGGPGGHQGGHRGPMGQGGPGGSRRPEHAYTAYQAG